MTLARLRPPFTVAIVFVLFFGAVANELGGDASPDLRLYHYYNGFAAFHDRSGLDVAAAQLQTMLFNGLDGLYYILFQALDAQPDALNAILSLPYALAAICVFVLAKLFFPTPRLLSHGVCATAALFGLTGAATLSTLSTTMTDITAALPLLIAMAYWFAREHSDSHSMRSTVLTGLLAGAAVGLKLTMAPVFIGLLVAIAARSLFGTRAALHQAMVFGLTGTAMFLVIDLPWMLHNIRAYGGNPIFPNLNNVFRSDYAADVSWADTRFMPKTLTMALFYPAYWTFRVSQDASELPMRDPRILIGCASALFVIAVTLVRRFASPDRLALCLALLYLTAYFIWEAEWSIYRYLAVEECLSGVMLMAAVSVGLRSRSPIGLVPIFLLVMLPAMAVTQYPLWSRAAPAPRAIDVVLPALEPDAMVIFLDAYAYAYLVPSMPPTVRAIGANSNIIHPGAPGLLQAHAEAAIDGHTGPLWGTDNVQGYPGEADATLRFYRLHRALDTCRIVQSNLERGPNIRICRLLRDASATAEPSPASFRP